MIATTSINLEVILQEREECYEALRNRGFSIGNNTQSLSHILPLFSGSVDEKVKRTVKVERALIDNKVPLKYYSLPMLSIAAIITDDPNTFAKEVREVSEKIKREEGFGNFAIGSTIRNMIATGLVASYYVERLSDLDKKRLIDTTNNLALTIQMVIEIAAAIAAAGAAAAASSGS